jgi:hypothetical protein
MEETKKRVSLTKSQCETDIGKELIALCMDFTDDGILSDDEVNQLRHWIGEKKAIELPAISYLNSATMLYFDSSKEEFKNKKMLYKAIESVLPIAERKIASTNKKHIETEEKLRIQKEKATDKLALKEEKERNKPILSANFMIAGCKYNNRYRLINKYVRINDKAILSRDKENKHSKYAVKLLTKQGYCIGFVPEFYAEEIASELDDNTKYEAFFTKILGYETPTPVVQAYFYRNDSDYGNPEKLQKSKQNKEGDVVINLATPIILIVIAIFIYLIFK